MNELCPFLRQILAVKESFAFLFNIFCPGVTHTQTYTNTLTSKNKHHIQWKTFNLNKHWVLGLRLEYNFWPLLEIGSHYFFHYIFGGDVNESYVRLSVHSYHSLTFNIYLHFCSNFVHSRLRLTHWCTASPLPSPPSPAQTGSASRIPRQSGLL